MKKSKTKQTPYIIPIFISHLGCPHRCIFCNQESITGSKADDEISEIVQFISENVRDSLNRLRDIQREVQVAFYGGSFTGLPLDQQESFLDAVYPFINSGQVQSIRLSTRPDYINQNSGKFLYDKGVRTVELGVQSMEPEVLKITRRGHNVSQVEEAFSLLRRSSLQIGGQLMVGLPGETVAGAVRGAAQLASLNPDLVRIYPTLVVGGSGLANLYKQGKFKPLSLNRAVAMTGRLKTIFDAHAIPVIRMGLQPSEDLTANLIVGPHHPAFGELVKSRLLFNKIRALLRKSVNHEGRELTVSTYDQSIFKGQKNCSLDRLKNLGLLNNVEIVFDDLQPRGDASLRLMG